MHPSAVRDPVTTICTLTMKANLLAGLISGIVAFSGVHAAPTLQVFASKWNLQVGETFTVTIGVGGLEWYSAPSLGVYDFDFQFDTSALTLQTVSFGYGLDTWGLGSFQAVTPIADGINLLEVSLDSPDELNNFQAGSFDLVTLTFETTAAKEDILLWPSVNSFGDADGLPIGDLQVFGMFIDIRDPNPPPPPPSIPEPATYALVLGAMSLAAAQRRRRQAHRAAPTLAVSA